VQDGTPRADRGGAPEVALPAGDSSGRCRILLDLTTAYSWRGRKAVGIIRTEREIARRLLGDATLEVLPFLFHGGQLRALELSFARAMLAEPDAPVLEPVAPPAVEPPPSRRARLIRPFAVAAKWATRHALQAVPSAARPEVALSLIHAREAVRRLIYPPVPPPAAPAPLVVALALPDLSLVLHPRRTDVIWTCGLAWDDLDWAPIALLKAQHGFRVVCLCYDLIPILFPQWVPSHGDLYLSHFLSMVDIADEVPCISACTARDLHDFAARYGRPAPRTSVVRLGANLPESPDPTGLPPALIERFRKGRFALAVGTFEVRKNYGLLLDVWERLARDPGFDLDLVLVGMRGWLIDELLARFEASPLHETRIFWLSDAGDALLSWLFEGCHVALYPSLYEGWGLPVVEALLHRRPVIASNRGAVPEAGLGLATIIDPDDFPGWCEAVAACARAPRVSVPAAPIPSWDETTADVRALLLRAGPARQIA
jgi:glycosyltransferase involved in cell wall biosynthesis